MLTLSKQFITGFVAQSTLNRAISVNVKRLNCTKKGKTNNDSY